MTSMPPPGRNPESDGSWSYSASTEGANPTPETTPALDPLFQRLLKVTAGLSALLILVVAFAWLHGSDEASLNPIAEAAAHTQEQPGSRIAMRGIYSLPDGRSMSMHGSGVYNARSGRSRLAMELTVPGVAAPLHFDAVGDKQTMYMRSSVFAAELPPGDRWLAVQMGLGRSAQTSLASNSGSEGQLEMLRAAGGKVEDLGEEMVRGLATTRYSGTVDLHRYADLLREEGKPTDAHEYEQLAKSMPGPIPVEAWLDDQGLVRRMRVVMDIPTAADAPTVKMDLTMEFFDFGIAPKIDLPAASETFDSTPLARAQLHLLDGGTMGIPSPDSGPPLSLTSFQSRSATICNDLIAKARRLASATRKLKANLDETERPNAATGGGRNAMLRAMRTYSTHVLEPAFRLGTDGMRRLARLSPPVSSRAAFGRYLHFSSISIEIDLAQTRALELGSFETVKQLEDARHKANQRTRQAGEDAKLAEACRTSDS